MALSGTLKTSSYSGRYYQLSWSATQNIAKNTSTISWTLSAVGGSSSYFAERTLKLIIAGETVFTKTDRVMRGVGKITSGTKTISHNANGSRSFKASISAAVYVTDVNCTGSETFTLNTIPRKATITSAPNFNDEANPTINYSNPAGNAVELLQACISLDGGADISYRNLSKTGTSYTFSLTNAERTFLRNATKTSNSRTIYFYIKTVIDGETFYHSIAKTLSIVNANPTITSASAEDVGSVSVALTGNNQTIIKGYNVVNCSMVASALKGATISSYKITNGSNIINGANGVFSYTANGKFTFEVTDSRGNISKKEINLTVIDYIKLTANVEGKIILNADDNTKADITFTVSGNYYNGSFGAVDNTLTVVYEVEDSSGGWSLETLRQYRFKDSYNQSNSEDCRHYRNRSKYSR